MNNMERVVLSIALALTLCISVSTMPVTVHASTTEVTIRSVDTDTDNDDGETGSYDKTGGIGLAPVIAALGASSVACLTLAHRLGKDDDGETTGA